MGTETGTERCDGYREVQRYREVRRVQRRDTYREVRQVQRSVLVGLALCQVDSDRPALGSFKNETKYLCF